MTSFKPPLLITVALGNFIPHPLNSYDILLKIAVKSFLSTTLMGGGWVASTIVSPEGIEPSFQPPEGCALSIKLWGRFYKK